MAMNIRDAFKDAVKDAGTRHLSNDQLAVLFKCSQGVYKSGSAEAVAAATRLLNAKDQQDTRIRW